MGLAQVFLFKVGRSWQQWAKMTQIQLPQWLGLGRAQTKHSTMHAEWGEADAVSTAFQKNPAQKKQQQNKKQQNNKQANNNVRMSMSPSYFNQFVALQYPVCRKNIVHMRIYTRARLWQQTTTVESRWNCKLSTVTVVTSATSDALCSAKRAVVNM